MNNTLISKRQLKLYLVVLTAIINVTSILAQSVKENSERITPTVKAVHKVMPSVVNLSTEKLVERAYSPWDEVYGIDHFFDKIHSNTLQKNFSLGSGSIIDPSGIIITNAHVVRRALRIHVTLADGRRFLAKEIASTELNDIALLKIVDLPAGEKLTPINFAKVNDLLLGETVIAVGNPYGLGNTITRGVLSAVNRKVTYRNQVLLSGILQTDAAINPGNSGGPLINIDGDMIGVNLAMHRNGYGIGFAVPIKRAENLIGRWLIPERFSNTSLGIIPAIRSLKDGSNQIYIADIIKDSPAWKAGLRSNEVITDLGSTPLKSLLDLSRHLWQKKAGESVSITLNNGKVYHIKLESISFTDGRKLARIRLGIELHELTSALASALGYPFNKGIIVGENLSGNHTIKRGNILVRLDDIPIYNYSDIARALQDKKYGDKIKGVFISVIHKNNQYILIKKPVSLTVR